MHSEHRIHIFINKKQFELNTMYRLENTSASAGIPLGDLLFLQRPGEDEVIANDAKIA